MSTGHTRACSHSWTVCFTRRSSTARCCWSRASVPFTSCITCITPSGAQKLTINFSVLWDLHLGLSNYGGSPSVLPLAIITLNLNPTSVTERCGPPVGGGWAQAGQRHTQRGEHVTIPSLGCGMDTRGGKARGMGGTHEEQGECPRNGCHTPL